MKGILRKTVLFLMVLATTVAYSAVPPAKVSGKVTTDGIPAAYVNIYLKNTSYGVPSDNEGRFAFTAPEGEYTLVASMVGYKTVEIPVRLLSAKNHTHDIVILEDSEMLAETVVTESELNRVKDTPYNVVAIDTKEMLNGNKNVSDALAKLSGVKLRETGGVGSDLQIMVDGFSGRHVKVFVDGVPHDGSAVALNLNNLPVTYAKRVEVYRGAVPVEFGGDALGAVVNIVTNKEQRQWFADASYTAGSFGTHKGHLFFGQTFGCGFHYEVNAFANYSDNDYYIKNWVREFEVREDGTVRFPPVNKKNVQRVRRFNDAFHNEVLSAKAGVVDKPFADRLMLGFSYTNFYKEIQNGVYQETVFGEKHRKGHSFVPSFEYSKRGLFLPGLDVTFNANYNYNITHNVDTASRAYNWRGEWYDKGSNGEQSYQRSQSRNENFNATFNAVYRMGTAHRFTFNNVFGSYNRTNRRQEGASSVLTNFDIPKVTRKNVSGFSYAFTPSDRWNVTAFVKYYSQYNRGPVSESADGVGNYVKMSRSTDHWGYGAAATYYPLNDLQLKLSYERACRLPSTDELFGDEDLEAGRTDLRPETSHNLNLNASYAIALAGKHKLFAEGSLIYRDTRDYIKRGIGKYGALQYGMYENHGHVRTEGFNVGVRYSFDNLLNVGAAYNSIDVRDHEKYMAGGTLQPSMHYKERLPNVPYRYANLDAQVNLSAVFTKGDALVLAYDGFWQHSFSLFWQNIGDASTKSSVPEQFSHNASITYSLADGRYNLSFECRNITDADLYDNFSLQKAGRAFYTKLRVSIGK